MASFFVSRIDTEADRQLQELGAEDLEGELAIAATPSWPTRSTNKSSAAPDGAS